jgi:hypothetical protein
VRSVPGKPFQISVERVKMECGEQVNLFDPDGHMEWEELQPLSSLSAGPWKRKVMLCNFAECNGDVFCPVGGRTGDIKGLMVKMGKTFVSEALSTLQRIEVRYCRFFLCIMQTLRIGSFFKLFVRRTLQQITRKTHSIQMFSFLQIPFGYAFDFMWIIYK